MAQFAVSADLISSGYPFNFEETANSIIIQSQYEIQQAAYRTNRGEDSAEVEVLPHAYFMQNVLPHKRGYTSIHFQNVLAPHNFSGVRIDAIYTLRDPIGNTALFSPAYGANLIYSPDFGGWQQYPDSPVEQVTVATLKGRSFVCYSKTVIKEYNFSTGVLDTVDLLGLDDVEIKGITAANNYLVAWTDDTIYWSSATNPLDFVPSLLTGAGSSGVLAAHAQIVITVPIADGFIAYTPLNAVGATYSGNAGQPWIFREIAGSAGCGRSEHISYESNQEAHVVWTSSGFQLVSFRGAQMLWPELSDSIARGIFTKVSEDDYPVLDLGGRINVKVSSVGARYTLVSAKKDDSLPFALSYCYDWALGRWGKIDIPHADVLDFRAPEFVQVQRWEDFTETDAWQSFLDSGIAWQQFGITGDEKATQFGLNFGFIRETGTVYTAHGSLDKDVTVDENSGAASPRLVLGVYKRARQEDLLLQEITVQSAVPSPLYCYVHDDSCNFVSKSLIADEQYSQLESKYLARLYGSGFSFELVERFSISSLDFIFSSGGKRNSPRNYGPDPEFALAESDFDTEVNVNLPRILGG